MLIYLGRRSLLQIHCRIHIFHLRNVRGYIAYVDIGPDPTLKFKEYKGKHNDTWKNSTADHHYTIYIRKSLLEYI